MTVTATHNGGIMTDMIPAAQPPPGTGQHLPWYLLCLITVLVHLVEERETGRLGG